MTRHAELDAILAGVRQRLAECEPRPTQEETARRMEVDRQRLQQGLPTLCHRPGLEPGQKWYGGTFSDLIELDEHGRSTGRNIGVTVYVQDATSYPLPHVVRHSPDGFAWGYGGSGPADLALSLLVDLLGEPGRDPALYQAFKWDVVARWDPTCFLISEPEIRAWLTWKEAEAR